MHADIDLATDTVPVLPLEAAVAPETTRFDAATRCGAISLQIDGVPAAHAADAALLLDRCDALLDALDAWLHCALEWRWVDVASLDEAPRACASACYAIEATESAGALTCRVEVPWALVRSLGAPPAALASRLHWSAVPAVVVVSQPAIDEAELRLLERGGAVVLPESMAASWPGRLHAAQEAAGDGLAVELTSAGAATLGAAAAAPNAGGRPVCEVRIAAARPLSPAQLAGWEAGATVDLAPRASLWRCTGPAAAERYLAGGRLLPWGDGWAMLIESV